MVGWVYCGGRLYINRECSFIELMIEFHSNPFHVLPNAGQSRVGLGKDSLWMGWGGLAWGGVW